MKTKPITREETYLAYAAGDTALSLPKPLTRKEQYLHDLCQLVISGGATPEQIEVYIRHYLEENPVQTGATAAQAAQIEANKGAIEDLQKSDFAKKSDIPTSLPASDVSIWAKQPEKPSYTAQEVGALPNTYTPPNQTAAQVGADPKGTATTAVSQHNASTDAHNDIRLALQTINNCLTAFFDSDDQTLDELSEIVAYITSNKTLIESITTSKVSVTDIINNLTTNISNKPLSAAQGVVLKGLIDTLSNSLSGYQPKGDYALRSEIPAVPTIFAASTSEVTPTQVLQAITEGSDVVIGHADATFGNVHFTYFIYAANLGMIVSSAVIKYSGNVMTCQLVGRLTSNTWESLIVPLPQKSDIPTMNEIVDAVIAALPVYNGEVG